MRRYLAFRVLSLVPVLFIISIIVFLIAYLLPGDPTDAYVQSDASEAVREALRVRLGLDKPVHVRYGIWLGNVLRGDLGMSAFGEQPVVRLIGNALPVSVEMMVLSQMIAVLVAVPLAIIAAVRRNSVLDVITSILAFAAWSIPSFWLGIVLVYFVSVRLHLLPATGYVRLSQSVTGNLRTIILPGFTLGILNAPGLMRYLRAGLLDALGEDYIMTARMKGVPEWKVLFRHALKNALIPFITVVGLNVARLIGGTFVIEEVWALPGMGRLVVDAILSRDYAVIQGGVLVMAISFVIVNLVVDLLCAMLDPRIRLSREDRTV
jgi:peptide/nickel transport system permease protein